MDQLPEFAGSARFEIVRRLGAGGMGVVYEAIDREREISVALKTIRNIDPTAIYYFKREFRSLAEVVHPNLVPLHELVSDGNHWFFTMELIRGGKDLLQFLAESDGNGNQPPNSEDHPETDEVQLSTKGQDEKFDETRSVLDVATAEMEHEATGSLSDESPIDETDFVVSPEGGEFSGPQQSRKFTLTDLSKLREVFRDLTLGVSALHEAGKLHRDLKPGNVMVRPDGQVVLLDFGLIGELSEQGGVSSLGAGSVEDTNASSSELLSSAKIVGTVGYMSPEQAGGRPLTPASDWYAVGVMLYCALSGGRLPFYGRPLDVLYEKQAKDPPDLRRTYNPQVPEELNTLCMALLARNPDDRPTGERIRQVLSHSPIAIEVPKNRAIPQENQFVGREHELALMMEAMEGVEQKGCLEFHLHGASGAGKSTLVSHFLERTLKTSSAVVLRNRCYQQESVPYKAIDGLVDALTGFLFRLPEDERRHLCPPTSAAIARMFPVLKRVLDQDESARTEVEVADPRQLRLRAEQELKELLYRLSMSRPLILMIDDLQWGDLESAELLKSLLETPFAPRMLLLLCYRSEYLDTSECLKSMVAGERTPNQNSKFLSLELEPLSPEETSQLARMLLGESAPTKLVERIARESDGSPLFVAELVRYVDSDQGTKSNEISGELELDAVLWQRINEMSGPIRELLEAISVAGQPLPIQCAYEAAGIEKLEPTAIAQLRASHLVRTSGSSLSDDVETYHDRIRETVLTHLPADTVKTRHGLLANSLDSSGRGDPETIATHYEHADERSKAGKFFGVAADQALDALAFDRAAKLYRSSLNLRPVEGELAKQMQARLGDALANAGRGAESAEAYRVAADAASDSDRIDLERRAAYQYCISGRVDEGREAMGRVLKHVGIRLPRGPRESLMALLPRRMWLRVRGTTHRRRAESEIDNRDLSRIEVSWSASAGLSMFDIIAGADFQARNLLLALKAGEPYRVARALAYEAVHLSNGGVAAAERTAAMIEKADAIAEEIQHPHALGMVAFAKGVSAYQLGQWTEAFKHTTQAEVIFRDRCTGVAWELGSSRAFSNWAQFYKGEFAECNRLAIAHLKDAQERGDLYTASQFGLFNAPLSELMRDRPDDALNVLKDYHSRCAHRRFHVQDVVYLLSHTYTCLYQNDAARARRELEDRWSELKSSLLLSGQLIRIAMFQVRARSILADADQDPATRHQSLREVHTIIKRLRRENVDWARALAGLLHAAAASLEGDPETAIQLLKEEAAGFERLEMKLYAQVCRWRLGQMLKGDEGARLVSEAEDWLAREEIVNPQRMAAMHSPGFGA